MIVKYKSEKVRLISGKNSFDTFIINGWTNGTERNEETNYYENQGLSLFLVVNKSISEEVQVILGNHDFLVLHKNGYGSGMSVEIDENGEYDPRIKIQCYFEDIQFGTFPKKEGESPRGGGRSKGKAKKRPAKKNARKPREYDEPEEYGEPESDEDIPF